MPIRTTTTLLLALTLFLTACNHPVEDNQLKLVNSQYCLKSTGKPYTGSVVRHFPNGNVAQEYNCVNGYAAGKWTTYDLQGKMVQQGEQLDASVLHTPAVAAIQCNRVSLNHYTSDATTFAELYIFGPQRPISPGTAHILAAAILQQFPPAAGHIQIYTVVDTSYTILYSDH